MEGAAVNKVCSLGSAATGKNIGGAGHGIGGNDMGGLYRCGGI